MIYLLIKKKMFEKILLDKIWLEKYKFYNQLPRKIKTKIENAWHNMERTKRYKNVSVNWHKTERREEEFNRLLKVFYLIN